MEHFEKGHKPDGYVNSVWESLNEAKTVALYLKKAKMGEEYYENWILERTVL